MVTVVLVGGHAGRGQVFQCADATVPERVIIDRYGQHARFVRTDETAVADGRELSIFQ